MAEKSELGSLREVIERVDRAVLELLRERMDVMEGVARQKLLSAVPLRDPLREEQVLERVRTQAAELRLDTHEVERLYRLIMEMSIARQQAHVSTLDTLPLRVGYQGVEGSYGHVAAQRRYAGRSGGVLLRGFETVREAVRALRSGELDFCFVALENTNAGSMNETYDLLEDGGVTITGELLLALHHRLLALPGATLSDITTVLSHPHALSQCARFLSTLPGVRLQPELDAAEAARKVRALYDRHAAAIASASAGVQFGLVPLEVDVQAGEQHQTRYVELALEAKPCPPGARCKTALVLSLEHRPGQLGEVLMVFARHGVNLVKLESRPIPGSLSSYRFYLEVEGHQASREMAAALEDARAHTSELRVLGTYPAAEELVSS